CRTRPETGAGVPQLQAIRAVFVATGGQIPIIADGGMENDKDIFLSIAFGGASSVMIGGMFAGTDESPGPILLNPATKLKYKVYRGMTSPEAVMDAHSTEDLEDRLGTPAEGQLKEIPYVGSVVGILKRIRGHVQSSVSYAGESNLADAYKKMSQEPEKFLIPLSEAARIESFHR
ncbi:MAG: IMP dehydrogenase, partial [Candidatus Paceibacterota bacterium]